MTIRFTRAQYDQLVEADRLLHDLIPVLDEWDGCGLDCSGFREIAADLSTKISRIRPRVEQHLYESGQLVRPHE